MRLKNSSLNTRQRHHIVLAHLQWSQGDRSKRNFLLYFHKMSFPHWFGVFFYVILNLNFDLLRLKLWHYEIMRALADRIDNGTFVDVVASFPVSNKSRSAGTWKASKSVLADAIFRAAFHNFTHDLLKPPCWIQESIRICKISLWIPRAHSSMSKQLLPSPSKPARQEHWKPGVKFSHCPSAAQLCSP